MDRRVIVITLLLILVVLAVRSLAVHRRSITLLPEWMATSVLQTPEESWARGHPVPFACVDLVDLELLPGVSEVLGLRLLAHRERIIEAAKHPQDASGLLSVFGLGEKKQRELARYLTFEKACDRALPVREKFAPLN
jgi:hypothetical protein